MSKISDNAPKRISHNYTSETELKSLVIREKNKKNNVGTTELNSKINEMIKEYKKSNDKSLRDEIIELSENTQIDEISHERFGEIIILMIKKILSKPNFSGYSWRDEFYSDGSYRTLKYIHNFDHKKTSKINNQSVSAFAYISQILHNSIIAIINQKNKETQEIDKYISEENANHELFEESKNSSKIDVNKKRKSREFEFDMKDDNETLVQKIKKLDLSKDMIYDIFYKNYVISYDEYYELHDIFKDCKGIINIAKISDKNSERTSK